MILLAYRHGLRASEVTGLRLSDLDLTSGTIYCRRAKGSRSSLHPLKPDEVAVLEKVLHGGQVQASDYVFQSERSERMSRSAFWRIVNCGEPSFKDREILKPISQSLNYKIGHLQS